MSDKRVSVGEGVRLLTKARTLLLVCMLGALVTVVFGATVEEMQRSEPPTAISHVGSGDAGVAAQADAQFAARVTSSETLYLLLLGVMLLCVAAGLSAVATGDGTDGRRTSDRVVSTRLKPSAVIHAAGATSTTR